MNIPQKQLDLKHTLGTPQCYISTPTQFEAWETEENMKNKS